MRKYVVLALVSATVLTGCASRYKITLTNGHVITTRSKPKLDATKRAYQFKDALGKPASIPVFRVQELEPL